MCLENHDPFLCQCNACKRFWVVTFGDRMKVLLLQTSQRVRATSRMYATLAEDTTQNASMVRSSKKKIKDNAPIRVGDQIITNKGYKGVVKFIGNLEEDVIAPKTFVGLQLYDQVSFSDNGIWKGKKYFHCKDGHGLIVPFNAVCRCSVASKRPPLSGNRMFPSYAGIQKSRLLARQGRSASPEVPRAYDGSKMNVTPVRNIVDCNDMAIKDYYKRKEQHRLDVQHKRIINDSDQIAQQRAAAIYKSNIEKLRRYGAQSNTGSTGSGRSETGSRASVTKRTERLAKTVLTLQKGYDIGVLGKWNRSESPTSLHSTQDGGDDGVKGVSSTSAVVGVAALDKMPSKSSLVKEGYRAAIRPVPTVNNIGLNTQRVNKVQIVID